MLGRRGGLLDGGLDNAQKLGQGSGCSDQFAGASNMPASLAVTQYFLFMISVSLCKIRMRMKIQFVIWKLIAKFIGVRLS